MTTSVTPIKHFPYCAKKQSMTALESYWKGVTTAQNRKLLKEFQKIDYEQLVKEMSNLHLADRLLVNRRGDLP